MDWYYAQDGRPVGPVNETGFAQLVAAGQITPATLVWHEGMPQWQPYRGVSPSPAIPTAAVPVGSLPSAPPGSSFVCTGCGQAFPESQVTRYGTVWVCTGCRPAFAQSYQPGLGGMPGNVRYAGFWMRFLAKFLDGLILTMVTGPLALLGILTSASAEPDVLPRFQPLFSLAGIVISAAYYIFFVGRFAATPGKMICQLKIITADGGPVSYARATGRICAEFLSRCPTLMIGYVMAGFDHQKRALHDHICGTRVVYRS